jgi:hypothetical protein
MTTEELLIIETYLGADSFRVTELVPVAETLLTEVKRLHGEAERNARFVEKVREIAAGVGGKLPDRDRATDAPTSFLLDVIDALRELDNAPVEPVKE